MGLIMVAFTEMVTGFTKIVIGFMPGEENGADEDLDSRQRDFSKCQLLTLGSGGRMRRGAHLFVGKV